MQSRIVTITLKKKIKARGLTLCDLKLYCKIQQLRLRINTSMEQNVGPRHISVQTGDIQQKFQDNSLRKVFKKKKTTVLQLVEKRKKLNPYLTTQNLSQGGSPKCKAIKL